MSSWNAIIPPALTKFTTPLVLNIKSICLDPVIWLFTAPIPYFCPIRSTIPVTVKNVPTSSAPI
eukprot:13573373-Ditylum_brightwellii.AAC.1